MLSGVTMTNPAEMAFIMTATILITQAAAVFMFWLLIQFVRGPEYYDDWEADEVVEPEPFTPTLEAKLAAARAALESEADDYGCADCGSDDIDDGCCMDCARRHEDERIELANDDRRIGFDG